LRQPMKHCGPAASAAAGRKSLTKHAGQGREHHIRAVLGGADCQQLVFGGAKVLERRVVRRQYRAGVPQHLLTDFGEQDAAAGALNHRLADHALYFAQVLADRGLIHLKMPMAK
jgi:hypothetical protein